MLPLYVLLLIPMWIRTMPIKGMDKQQRNQLAIKIFFLILLVLLAFRHHTVGNDTLNYRYYFFKFNDMPWRHIINIKTEPGFAVFNKTVGLLSDNPQVFIAVSAIVTIALILPTYIRLCEDASVTIVLFCTMSTFVMLFSGLRQSLAIAIGFAAYNFVRRKKWFWYLLVTAIAISIHTSAFMLLLMPIYHVKLTRKWLYLVVPMIGSIFVFNEQIFSILGVFLQHYTRFDASISNTGAYTMLILFVLFAVFAFIVPDPAQMDEETNGLRNYLLLALVIQMFAPLHTLAMRMNYYYIIFIPLLIPQIIKISSVQMRQIAVFARYVILIVLLIYVCMNATNGGGLHVFPYHFCWEIA